MCEQLDDYKAVLLNFLSSNIKSSDMMNNRLNFQCTNA